MRCTNMTMKNIYNLFTTPQNTELSKAHMKWRAQECSIRLLDDNNIYCTCECCGVDFIVELFEVPEYFIRNAQHYEDLLVLNRFFS